MMGMEAAAIDAEASTSESRRLIVILLAPYPVFYRRALDDRKPGAPWPRLFHSGGDKVKRRRRFHPRRNRLIVSPLQRHPLMRMPKTVRSAEMLGRVRLSQSFFMRDFLHSEIANIHGISNVPDDPDLAIAAGQHLCEELLE